MYKLLIGRYRYFFIFALMGFTYIFSFSCTQKAEYKSLGKKSASVSPESLSITDTKVIPWRPSRNFSTEVSRGLRVTFELPVLKSDALKDLNANKGVDSWFIRLIRKKSMGKRVLGRMKVPLYNPSSRTSFQGGIKKVVIDINYASFSMSSRFESFKCPAFGHDLVLDKHQITRNIGQTYDLIVGPAQDKHATGKLQSYGLQPATFNGGKSLVGTYLIELGLFNSKSKKIKSNIVEYQDRVEIISEVEKAIDGCQGFEVPLQPRKKIRKGGFKFGS